MTHIFSSPNEYSPTYLFNRRILDDVFNSFYFHDPRSLGKFNKWTIEDQQPGLREIICSWSSYYSIYLIGGAITILKNISQWEGLSHILWKITTVWNHQPDIYIYTSYHLKSGVKIKLLWNRSAHTINNAVIPRTNCRKCCCSFTIK